MTQSLPKRIIAKENSARGWKLLISALVFGLSMALGPYYVHGDQSYYRMVYLNLPKYNISAGYLYYVQSLSSFELVHFLLTWVASRFIGKDFFIALCNSVLAYCSLAFFENRRAGRFISALIVLTNYYYFVLYFSAERLKFGMIFVLMAMLSVGQIGRFAGLSVLSVLSHVQTLIIFISMAFSRFSNALKRLLFMGKIRKVFALMLLLGVALIAFGLRQVLHKLSYYYSIHGIQDLLKIAVFYVLALIYSRRRAETTAVFIVLFVTVFLVGGDRVNIFGFYAFLYFGLHKNKGTNVGVIGTSLYYGVQSVLFINRLLTTGTGY